ncbi:hypothetical protein D3C74_310300 [compost metagenome]
MNDLTEVQREEMRHALGLNYDKKPTRNYFYTDADDSDWNDLVEKGYARKRPGWDEESAYFSVTDEGKKVLGVSHE